MAKLSEKRFVWKCDDENCHIFDTKEEKAYFNVEVVDKLNELSEEKEYFERKKEYFLSEWSIVNAKNIQLRQEIKELKKENEQLRKQCFELEKDYLIETSDISDKIYLDDEIKELKQRYGVDDE